VKFCGPDSKKRQGQLYLIFAALGKAQTLTGETSACPTDTRPGSLYTTGLFSLVLEAENFDRCLSECGERGIQYTERGAIEHACNYIVIFFDYFPIYCAQFKYADNNINILLKMQLAT
jgi:hypothetical protein